MKLAIIGSRTFNDVNFFVEILHNHFFNGFTSKYLPFEIISGGAKGADTLAANFASVHNIKYVEYPAEWAKYGKSAGFKRNQQIINACDMVVAFWDGKSKGAEHSINLAKLLKKPTFIVYF
jgi:hypothetical protein